MGIIPVIVFSFCILALAVCIGVLKIKLEEANDKLVKVALKVSECIDTLNRVDESTGSEIYKLRKEFDEWKTDYGEAAVDALREEARQQKAFADGINSIMQFGADLQNRGGK